MSITPSLLGQARIELEQERAKIDSAIGLLNAFDKALGELYGAQPVPAVVAVTPVTVPKQRLGGNRSAATPPQSTKTEDD